MVGTYLLESHNDPKLVLNIKWNFQVASGGFSYKQLMSGFGMCVILTYFRFIIHLIQQGIQSGGSIHDINCLISGLFTVNAMWTY